MFFQQLQANISAKSGPSILSADLVVFGNISSAGEIQLEGKVLGDVHSSDLTIGHAGRVEGDITAVRVTVFGEIVGSLSARTVFVGSTARVDGNLLVENLAVEPGGHFEGHCARAEISTRDFATETAASQPSIINQAFVTEAAD